MAKAIMKPKKATTATSTGQVEPGHFIYGKVPFIKLCMIADTKIDDGSQHQQRTGDGIEGDLEGCRQPFCPPYRPSMKKTGNSMIPRKI
jgi:hypothetical protein